MGMTTHVYGFKPPNNKWKIMKKIYDSCIEADVSIPSEVEKFFEGDFPDDAGVRVDLGNSVTKYSNDSEDGIEVDLSKLTKDVVIIRFVNMY